MGPRLRGDVDSWNASLNLTALASKGPVFIPDRGRPAHVLLSIEEYQRLTRTGKITDLLSMPEAAEVELVIPPLDDVAVPADLA